jgi:hypothetical protein
VISRAVVAMWSAVLALVALMGVQWFVTTPGMVTDRELHTMMLAAIPAMTVVLSAFWVDAGRRENRR